MKSLKDLLLKHKIPGIRLSENRHICAQITSNIIKIKIKASQVDYFEGKVIFKVSPIIKTEILLHQEEIVKQIKSEGVSVSLVQ